MFKTAKIKLKNIFTKVDRQENTPFQRFPDFGPLEIENHNKFLVSSKKYFYSQWKKPVKCSETIKSFDIIELLGEGMYSEVFLIKHLVREELYALKVVEKAMLVRKRQVQYPINEKWALKGLNSPFTIYLVSSFMDSNFLYFVLPFIPGGELFQYLVQFRKFSERQTRFYLAQIVLALEYLHYLELVYRDLKPENVLIDHLGYLKLADFGFCKRVRGRTYTLCGTPQYLAPEVVLGRGYGTAVDWWSLGVFVFELSAGRSPFQADNVEDICENILACKYRMSNTFSVELKHLITSLLQVDLSQRFGNLKNGVNDLKNHLWFRPINWMAILNRKVPADFIPQFEITQANRESADNFKMKLLNMGTEDNFGKVFSNF